MTFEGAPGEGLRVLLVTADREREGWARTEMGSRPTGTEVVSVGGEEQFAQALDTGEFDVVVTEAQLPWTDGVAVLRTTKDRYPDCPVIMLTGPGDLGLAAEAGSWGLFGSFMGGSRSFSGLAEVVASARDDIVQRRSGVGVGARRTLGDVMPTGLFRSTAEGRIIEANPAFVQILGYPDEDSLLVARADDLYARREDFDRWRRLLDRHGAVAGFETELKRADGAVIRVDQSARAVRGGDARIAYYEGTLRDVTERRRAEEGRIRREAAAKEAVRKPVPLASEQEARVLQSISSVTGEEFFRALVRHLAETFEVRFAWISEIIEPQIRRVRIISAWKDAVHEGGVEYGLHNTACDTVVGKARAYYPLNLHNLFPKDPWLRRHGIQSYFGEPIFDRMGNPLGHFAMMHDRPLRVDPVFNPLLRILTARAAGEIERRKAEEHLSHIAHHDTETDIPNRVLFMDRLNQGLARANWHNVLVAVLLVELDRFKMINDAAGRTVGDRLLREVADRLKACVRDGDTVARLEGEEFAVSLLDVASPNDVAPIARKMLNGITQLFEVDGEKFALGASIGISLYPTDGEDAETLLRNAQAATRNAKKTRRNQYHFYTGTMNIRAAERLRMELQLRRAVERQEFTVHYQPQVDLTTRRTMGVEALIRWRHPESGLVSPTQFISQLEETGLIVPVGEWVLRTACAQNKAWQDAGITLPRMSVNLSGRQLNDPSFTHMVRRVLEETRLDPGALELEITESMIENADEAIKILQGVSQMGVTLAIDDFGTGYSSLSYLKSFPLNTLKIDRAFVRDVTTDNDDAAIAKAIIAMAHSLKLRVIAEGVETEEQLQFLYDESCDEVQGFLCGRPAPALEVGPALHREQMD